MKLSDINDKQKVISIIEESFNDNPSIKWLIKNDCKRQERIKALAEYLFESGMNRKGVYLSSDKEAVAICYRKNYSKNSTKELILTLKLIINTIGCINALKVLKRQCYLNAHRPPDSDYLYFWLFGSSEKGKRQGSAYELQKGIFGLSESLKLPIYMETSIMQNRKVYERFGFNVYHTWQMKEQGITMWLMKREI